MIKFTDRQLQAVKNGSAIRISVFEIGEDLVVLRAAQFESMRELLDRYEQQAILRYSMTQASKASQENPY